jgi:hypothetical protein
MYLIIPWFLEDGWALCQRGVLRSEEHLGQPLQVVVGLLRVGRDGRHGRFDIRAEQSG